MIAKPVRPRSLLAGLALLLLLALLQWTLTLRSARNFLDPEGPKRTTDNAVPPTFDGTLRVVTWNIRFGEQVDAAIAAFWEHPTLRDADILLLQEVDGEGVEEIASTLGYNSVYYPASVHTHHGKWFGNAILSRWSILDSGKIILPYASPLNGQRRIAVRATIEAGGREVVVYNVHTETFALSQQRRSGQVAALVEDIARLDREQVIIVGGDFNTVTGVSQEDLAEQMAGVGLYPLTNSGAGTLLARTPVTLDHLFGRGVVAREGGVELEALASDHFPVWAVVTLKE